MKQALKKALAVLLAALMLLGVGGVGAEENAALPEEAGENAEVVLALPEEAGEVTAAAFPAGFDKDEAVELALGEPVKASDFGAAKIMWFKFAPAESRGYYFASYAPGAFYSIENTKAVLYDENGNHLRSSERWNTGFVLHQELESGKTYYLSYAFDEAGREYTFEAKVSGKLIVPKKKITMKPGKVYLFADILKGTTWDLSDLRISVLYPLMRTEDRKGFYTTRSNREDSISVRAPDGEEIWIEVTVSLKTWEWIVFIPILLLAWPVVLFFGFIGYVFEDHF